MLLGFWIPEVSLNIRQPASAMERASLRFLTIPDTFRSSNTTVWFSRMMRVES